MADTTLPGLLATGDHASRPAASAVGSGGLYSCTTHSLVYQTDGSSWTTWATLSAGGVTLTTKGDLLGYGSGLDRLPVGTDGQVLTADAASTLGIKWGAAAAGGITHAYVGYNTIGGSSEAIVNRRQYMKKITLAADCLMPSIGVYLKQNNTSTSVSVNAGLLTDSGGSPSLLIAHDTADGNETNFLATSGSAGAARWFHVPIGVWCTAGDYWIAVQMSMANANDYFIYYDGSGGDRYFTNNGDNRMTDSGWTTVTTSSNKYSIRASTIS